MPMYPPLSWRLGNFWYRLHIRWAILDCLTLEEVAAVRATEIDASVPVYSTSSEFSTVSERASASSDPGADSLDQLD